MAKPCRPFARAAAMFSSGLETPSPEKNVCVCRSMLNGIAREASLRAREMESVGFKEWALVCEALGRGGRAFSCAKAASPKGATGFGFRHPEFFLFPTFFHEQAGEGANEPARKFRRNATGEIEIRYFREARGARRRSRRGRTAAALEPFHILQETVVRERFEYEGAGLHVALCACFGSSRLDFADMPGYGGCRSWVNCRTSDGLRFEPVLTIMSTRAGWRNSARP